MCPSSLYTVRQFAEDHLGKISTRDVANIITGKVERYDPLSIWEKIKAFFMGSQQKEALKEFKAFFRTYKLHDICKNNPHYSSAVLQRYRNFVNLRSLALPVSKSVFHVNLTQENTDTYVTYYIGRNKVFSEKCQSAADINYIHNAEKLYAHNGQSSDSISPDELESALVPVDSESLTKVSPEDFTHSKNCGVNKSYVASVGVLQARNDKGYEDFKREGIIQDYVNKCNVPELKALLSFQNSIRPDEIPAHWDKSKHYARVNRYDPNKFAVFTFREYINTLLSDNEKDKENLEKYDIVEKLVTEVINAVQLMYENQIVHNDMHMDNCQVIVDRNDSKRIKIQFFDFGRATVGNNISEPFADIKYLFNREGMTPFETIARNIAPENARVLKKHYPLNKFLSTLSTDNTWTDKVKKYLEELGNKLVAGLSNPELLPSHVFDEARRGLKEYIDIEKNYFVNKSNNQKYHTHLKSALTQAMSESIIIAAQKKENERP